MFAINARMCLPSKPFQPSLIFASKAGTHLNEATFTCATLKWAPSLTHKRETRLERLAMDKHYTLTQNFENYGRKKF